jgi:UDP-N-acetyl-2-amino-2-deoxyglucuronate dehydrogenase
VAWADPVPGKAAAFVPGHAPDATAFESVEAMLGSGQIEAVCVCTPHPQHADVVVAAAGHGVHAIVEKPFTVTLADADRAIAAARAAGTRIDDGRLGRPIIGEAVVEFWRGPDYYDLAPWRGKWDTEGGGVLINQAPHMVDLLQWYMGEVEEVFCYWDNLIHPYIPVEDAAVAVLRFKGGGMGLLKANNCTNPQIRFGVIITGSTGATASIVINEGDQLGHNYVWTLPGDDGAIERWRAEDLATGLREMPDFHALQLREFLAAIREGRDPIVTGEEGRKTVEILQALYRSGRAHAPVRLPLGEGESSSDF